MTLFSYLRAPLAVALLLAVDLANSNPTSTVERSYTTTIQWGPCPSAAAPPEALPSLLCGQLSVPIDWNDPNGAHFNLGIMKLPAPKNATGPKVGNLFINPGGPGTAASYFVSKLASAQDLLQLIGGAFDIIGVDPRGLGLSNPIKCDASIFNERVSLWPTTQPEFDKLVSKNKRLGESCRNLTGPLIEHIDTLSIVKDHEAVRSALGADSKMDFLGISYGSQIAAQYAQLYPKNVRTLVLDGVLQHSQSESSNLLAEATTFEYTLKGFLAWARAEKTSPLYNHDTLKLWASLVTNATRAPLPAPGCDGASNCKKDVSAQELIVNAQSMLTYADPNFMLPNNWGTLARALLQASQGNATLLSDTTPVQFAASASDPSIYFTAVSCLDWTHSTASSLPGVLAQERLVGTVAPLTRGLGQMWLIQHRCVGWPVPVKNPPARLDVRTDATVVLINSRGDKSTSFAWAVGMLEEMGKAVLVTREGYGHTSFLLGGEATRLMVGYFVNGTVPSPATVVKS